jgi:hypothetical protein
VRSWGNVVWKKLSASGCSGVKKSAAELDGAAAKKGWGIAGRVEESGRWQSRARTGGGGLVQNLRREGAIEGEARRCIVHVSQIHSLPSPRGAEAPSCSHRPLGCQRSRIVHGIDTFSCPSQNRGMRSRRRLLLGAVSSCSYSNAFFFVLCPGSSWDIPALWQRHRHGIGHGKGLLQRTIRSVGLSRRWVMQPWVMFAARNPTS